jgi:glycosyltransferase involved in cell wall biosynthesis
MKKVTVLMTAYNAEKYIAEAIESVLCQSFTDFEFVIINDGSTDNTEAEIRKYNDNRINYYSQENKGLSRSLNIGLKMAKGKYIARIDADDLCYLNRLELQYNFMEDHPEYVVCGSYGDVIDENGEYIYTSKSQPLLNSDIQREMEFKNCFSHSSTFFVREKALSIGGYYEEIKGGFFDDYIFFYKMIKQGKGYNFNEALFKYRMTPGCITIRNRSKRYNKLVLDVTHRGFITKSEADFLNSYSKKQKKSNIELSNHYLAVSRLILIHQSDIGKSIGVFIKAIKPYPYNVNIVLSWFYMWFVFLRMKVASILIFRN